MRASGSRHAEVFQRISTICAPDGIDAGEARVHCESARTSENHATLITERGVARVRVSPSQTSLHYSKGQHIPLPNALREVTVSAQPNERADGGP